MIRMQEDVPSNYTSGKLPILDLEVWFNGDRIYHQFYKKPMASRVVVQARSAFATSKKRSILLEEGQRRLRNCSPELSWEKKSIFLNRFSSDMKRSGHCTSFRSTVLKRVILKYQVDLSNHLEGKRTMYRSRCERLQQKESQKNGNLKDTWFRSGGATSTLTVPATPNGELADLVRRNLEKSRQPNGTSTKVIEDGGTSTRIGLVKSNQFPSDHCWREDCMMCFQKDGRTEQTRCSNRNIGYEGQCTRCPERFVYVGETSRTGYTRTREHLNDYRAAAAAKLPALPDPGPGTNGNERKRDVKSWMWEHTRDNHEGAVGEVRGMKDYKFKVTGIFRKCLQRQVNEGIQIQKCEAERDKLLNSKNEYFQPKTIQTLFRQW